MSGDVLRGPGFGDTSPAMRSSRESVRRADKVRLRQSRSVKTRGRHRKKMGGPATRRPSDWTAAGPPLGEYNLSSFSHLSEYIRGLSTAFQNGVDKPLMPLDMELENTIRLVDCIIQQRSTGLSQHIPALTSSLLPLLKSPLSASRIHALFVQLAGSVMPAHLRTFGKLLAHITLRLLKPECNLDPAWCQEDLPVAVKRAVNLLHTYTVPKRKDDPGFRRGYRVNSHTCSPTKRTMSTACTATPYPHRSLSRTKILAHKRAQKSGPGSVPPTHSPSRACRSEETRTSISSKDV
ncbi:unnamed protein product [Ranitomeya imitator]|uniref:Uncharacterized protein n=1 Tax=Ranitomeya imitator TaxID=111125 RepID=A0ABN9MDT3_9NEOB|nr:unnamed protein product [Ranitomeya imitator]